ncbi:VRR-NUC domain-containing protein [Burkholderia pyrrocinia]|uniref:VRR-NUC domain-containing protein n=1 Tax=Burkholderia pyrrocinia TaxID=60550 RepID=UPI0015897C2C|nr:VRR-NUC domain-containing protein [Burkholderia pyrrocinia]
MAGSTPRKVGNSRTLPQPQGKTIPVLPPEDTTYPCQAICHCNCNASLSSRGRKLKQRCVTLAVRFDCDRALQVWQYKGEVGYNMKNQPPSPIMSSLMANQPFQFPVGIDTKDLENAIALAELTGRAQKGFLRIPDVIVVKNRLNFDLSQPNIQYVVEIKFPGDYWRPGQERDYIRIAGARSRVQELSPEVCICKECRERAKAKAPATQRLPQSVIAKNETDRVRRIREHNDNVRDHPVPEVYGGLQNEPTALADYLKTGLSVLAAVAVVVVAVEAAPIVAAAAGIALVVTTPARANETATTN